MARRGNSFLNDKRRWVFLKTPKTDNSGRTPNLFLIEMLIALLFFCISGAVILQVFASAYGYMQKNKRSDSAALCAQACAEVYSGNGDIEEMLSDVFGREYITENGIYTISLNDDCIPSEEATILLTVSETENTTSAGIFSTATVEFSYDDEYFYSLSFSAYIPKNGGGTDE